VYKTPIAGLKRCVESVTGQIYPNWELCLADDGSGDPAIAALLEEYAGRDARIRAVSLPQNRGIAGATNEALRLCTGEYVAFLDHDDELADFALWEVVRAINDHPDTDLFYSDEDKIDEHGRRYDAFFKPGWSPDLFLSCNYICNFVVLKRSLMDCLGGLNERYNGSQDYEFLLRATEQTQKIQRIPRVLYHWRAQPGSTAKAITGKPRASEDGRQALAAYLARTTPGATVEEIKPCRYRVRYHPNILRVFEIGNVEGRAYAAEEYVKRTLADRLGNGPLRADEAVVLTRTLALTLGYIRNHHMMQPNLTPTTILLTDNDDPKLFDLERTDVVEKWDVQKRFHCEDCRAQSK
jgi:glycosyltransferase involved in cell wall biosynthesis